MPVHVGAEATVAHADGLPVPVAQGARQLEEVQYLVQGDGLDGLSALQLGKAGLLVLAGGTYLRHGR